jgi:hypothetical protein
MMVHGGVEEVSRVDWRRNLLVELGSPEDIEENCTEGMGY